MQKYLIILLTFLTGSTIHPMYSSRPTPAAQSHREDVRQNPTMNQPSAASQIASTSITLATQMMVQGVVAPVAAAFGQQLVQNLFGMPVTREQKAEGDFAHCVFENIQMSENSGKIPPLCRQLAAALVKAQGHQGYIKITDILGQAEKHK